MDQEKKEIGKWWLWILLLIAITIIMFTVLDTVGFFTKTVVERKVFENSYQYKKG